MNHGDAEVDLPFNTGYLLHKINWNDTYRIRKLKKDQLKTNSKV